MSRLIEQMPRTSKRWLRSRSAAEEGATTVDASPGVCALNQGRTMRAAVVDPHCAVDQSIGLGSFPTGLLCRRDRFPAVNGLA
jgi:hypothetical protein